MTHHSVERRQQLQNFEVVAAHAPAAAATAAVVAAAADAAAAVAAVGQHECLDPPRWRCCCSPGLNSSWSCSEID
jgi:hypothetical protein